MNKKIKGKKLEMGQIFSEDGKVIPTTTLILDDKNNLQLGEIIDVHGVSKGKGFAGVVKRWSFAGGPKSHGQKNKHRSPGSIGGGTDPGKVWKGQKMPGRMGSHRTTVKNLEVVKIEDFAAGEKVWVKGAVPGTRNSLVTITRKSNMEVSAE